MNTHLDTSLFPFNIVFDEKMVIVSTGPSIQKACGKDMSGKKLTDLFCLELPEHGKLQISWIKDAKDQYVLIRHERSGLRLRGGFVTTQNPMQYAFLGSAWLKDANELEIFDLTMSDFSVVDPMFDMIMLMQFNKMALEDAIAGAEKIRNQTKEINEKNELLIESKSKLNAIMDSIKEYAILLISKDKEIEYVNAVATEMLGICLDSSNEYELDWLVNCEDGYTFDRLISDSIHHGKMECRAITKRADSSIFNSLIICSPVRKDNIEGVCLVISDVTESLRKKNELEHLRKTEIIGQISGGIAHNLNNMMGIIIGNLEILSEIMPPTDRFASETMDHLSRAVNEASEVVHSLLQYSRKMPSKKDIINLNEIIKEISKLATSLFNNTGDLLIELSDEPLFIEIDQQALKSSVMNLLINSRDACASKNDRKIYLRTSSKMQSSGDKMVCIEVTDNGEGIPDDLIQKVTDPFFTTKGYGKGTGLGLSMVKGFAEQHGGFFAISSIYGYGTRAVISMPAAQSSNDIQSQEMSCTG